MLTKIAIILMSRSLKVSLPLNLSSAKECNGIYYLSHSAEKEEIKLKKPRPGTKIADLTNIIEKQLHRRTLSKPAGGVDP